MKTIILSLFAIAVLLQVTSCQKDKLTTSTDNGTSTSLSSSLKKSFPDATNVSWNMENTDLHEAEFLSESKVKTADFSANGTLLRKGIKIKFTDLPILAQEYIFKKYYDYTVMSVYEKIAKDGTKHYGVKLNKNQEFVKIRFDAAGIVLREVAYVNEPNGDNNNHDKNCVVTKLSASDLPASVTAFLTTNYGCKYIFMSC